MDQRPFLSIPLSLVIVLFFALILYVPERRRDRPPGPARPRAGGVSIRGPVSRVVSRSDPAQEFTVVGRGESLGDVASRVYGDRKMAVELWRANRDILARPDSPLIPRTLLRAPRFAPAHTALRK